eukprot:gene7988-1211_t
MGLRKSATISSAAREWADLDAMSDACLRAKDQLGLIFRGGPELAQGQPGPDRVVLPGLGRSINMCKQHAKNLLHSSKMALPTDFALKMAFISYKDHGDAGQLEFIQFTRDEKCLDSFIQSLHPTGGGLDGLGCGCEDVVGGLKTVHAMGMSSTMGDSQTPISMAYALMVSKPLLTLVHPQTHMLSLGVKPQTLLTQLAGLGVDYYFVHVDPPHTDIMVAKFQDAYALADRRRIFESMRIDEFRADFLTAMLGALSRSMGVRPLTGEALAGRLARARAR